MIKRVLFLLSIAYVSCLPPPHPAVVAARHAEDLLPIHLRKPALWNPHLQEILPLTSLLHSGEKPVFEREADNVPRREIYKILTHAGLIGRKRYIQDLLTNSRYNGHRISETHDSPFVLSPDILQYLK